MQGEMMEVVNERIIEAAAALIQIGNEKLDVKTAYWLGRNLKQLEPASKKIEKARTDIIEKYGVADETTGKVTIPKTIKSEEIRGEKDIPNPAMKYADEEFKEYLAKTSTVQIMKIKLSAFDKIGIHTINAIDFMLDVDIV